LLVSGKRRPPLPTRTSAPIERRETTATPLDRPLHAVAAFAGARPKAVVRAQRCCLLQRQGRHELMTKADCSLWS